MKFQLILSSIFCKLKLHLQSKKKKVGNRDASAILEISGKRKYAIYWTGSNDRFELF